MSGWKKFAKLFRLVHYIIGLDLFKFETIVVSDNNIMQYFFIGLNLMNVFHFSEKRDLCLMKRSIKTHQNLTYLIFFDTKTQVLNFFL